MHGFLALDKPEGMSSHAVVQAVRRACGTRRVGHAGTLDPLATGVLLIGIGYATRLIEYLTAQRKTYRATMRLGMVTDSQDITGSILETRDIPSISSEQLRSVCAGFEGEIDQVPPMFSALKKDGVPLYRLARKGEEVERQKRRISIFSIDPVFCSDNEILLDVECSKGTYIRTLCHDIGLEIGCGACMTQLRRTASGNFSAANLTGLEDLREGNFTIITPLEGLSHLPQLHLSATGKERLRNGIPPKVEHVSPLRAGVEDDDLVLLCEDDKLLAVVSPDLEHRQEHRGDFKLHKVFPDGI
jgi:tRNA pseudouridine55 synthase